MTGEVVFLDNVTTLDLPPDRILERAIGECPGGVIVMGYDADGDMYFASSIASGPDCLWLMEKAKAALLDAGED